MDNLGNVSAVVLFIIAIVYFVQKQRDRHPRGKFDVNVVNVLGKPHLKYKVTNVGKIPFYLKKIEIIISSGVTLPPHWQTSDEDYPVPYLLIDSVRIAPDIIEESGEPISSGFTKLDLPHQISPNDTWEGEERNILSILSRYGIKKFEATEKTGKRFFVKRRDLKRIIKEIQIHSKTN
jgi:hypothetical protein